jgi:hypothetical protein
MEAQGGLSTLWRPKGAYLPYGGPRGPIYLMEAQGGLSTSHKEAQQKYLFLFTLNNTCILL